MYDPYAHNDDDGKDRDDGVPFGGYFDDDDDGDDFDPDAPDLDEADPQMPGWIP